MHEFINVGLALPSPWAPLSSRWDSLRQAQPSITVVYHSKKQIETACLMAP